MSTLHTSRIPAGYATVLKVGKGRWEVRHPTIEGCNTRMYGTDEDEAREDASIMNRGYRYARALSAQSSLESKALASLVEMRSELADLLEAKIDAESRSTALVDVLAKVRAYPAIVRADALIAELSAGAV